MVSKTIAPSHLRQQTWPSESWRIPDCALAKGVEMMDSESEIDTSKSINDSHRQMHSISIRVTLSDQEERNITDGIPNPPATSIAASTEHLEHVEFYSQPIPAGTAYAGAAINCESSNPVENQQRNPVMDRQFDSFKIWSGRLNPVIDRQFNSESSNPVENQQRNPVMDGQFDSFKTWSGRLNPVMDRRFNSFKTWSGRLERQLSQLRGKQSEPEPEVNVSQNAEIEAIPVDRYFDALEGPELDTLRASEELVLPEDKKWPFLLRYPITSFGICLGVSSQAVLWKNLATIKSMSFLHISPIVNLVLWCISVALMITVFFIYFLKVVLYFEAVRREYYHPVRVNFFFAPWIICLLLAIGVPPLVANNLHVAVWYILMTPIFCLELKIYGQWMLGSQRRLSTVANPTNNLAIVGNFTLAFLGASMGLKEEPIFFFSVGLAHYIVLFVTLYQKLPTNESLPKDLHPVFFLFVVTPSMMSLAWAQIQGVFDYGARIPYFFGLFIYFSLVVRLNFFRGFRFSVTWWAYTFPMTVASIATIRYSEEVTTLVTQIMSVTLSSISTLMVLLMLITTIFHAFVLRDLFPNDIAIAISKKRPDTSKVQSQSSDPIGIEASPKSVSSTD